MGHGPDYNYNKRAKQREKNYEEMQELFYEFSKRKDTKILYKAYHKYNDADIGDSFLYALMRHTGIENLKKDNSEFEYESKLNVFATGPQKEPGEQLYLAEISKSIPYEKGFLNNQECNSRESTHYFFVGKKEETVIIESCRGTKIKKKSLESISSCPFVLKRKDIVTETNSIRDSLIEVYKAGLNGQRYIGQIERKRARNEFISAKSGRVYTLFFDKCHIINLEGIEKDRNQIEIEYMGNLPDFPGFKKSEDQIYQEISSLANIIKTSAKGLRIDRWKIGNLVLTNDKKSDFLLK